MPGRPTNLNNSKVGPTVLVVGAGRGCLDIVSLNCHFLLLPPPPLSPGNGPI